MGSCVRWFQHVGLCSHAIGTQRDFECSALKQGGEEFGSPYSRLIHARTTTHLHVVGEPE